MLTEEIIKVLERLKPGGEDYFIENMAIDKAIEALTFLRDYKDPNIYPVWMEGYAATGESGTAQFLGVTHAENFIEAVRKLNRRDWKPAYKGDPHTADDYFSIRDGVPAIWGCRCFDNEADAIKSFG